MHFVSIVDVWTANDSSAPCKSAGRIDGQQATQKRTYNPPYCYGLAARAGGIYNALACSGGAVFVWITTDATTGGYEARAPRHSGPRFLWRPNKCAAAQPRDGDGFRRRQRTHVSRYDDGWSSLRSDERTQNLGFRVPPEGLQLQLGGKPVATQRNFKISLS